MDEQIKISVEYVGSSGRILEVRTLEVAPHHPLDEITEVAEAVEALEARWIGGRVRIVELTRDEPA